ncbi:MAG: hemolysin III family protein [Peptococcaceae bacterium]|jgi:hemolysin III|nr:hemolysin III family protein [Peptococcaceae bacterium]
MMQTKDMRITLPGYSRAEELVNMISHIVGGALGIVALVLCLTVAALHQNLWGVASSIVYGISMILLYTMSSIYHGLVHQTAKRVFRVLDHCTIFLMIAGTYTPIALSALRPQQPGLAWGYFGLEWGLAILAITLTAINLKKYQAFSMFCYLIMGWCIVPAFHSLLQVLTVPGFNLLLAGGILYTLGAVFYGIGKKKKFIHGVFHLFVFLGSLMHFLCIIIYVL